MPDFKVIYDRHPQLDHANSLDVLAFLLVPDAAFLDGDETRSERDVIIRMLTDARRNALLHWYWKHTEPR